MISPNINTIILDFMLLSSSGEVKYIAVELTTISLTIVAKLFTRLDTTLIE